MVPTDPLLRYVRPHRTIDGQSISVDLTKVPAPDPPEVPKDETAAAVERLLKLHNRPGEGYNWYGTTSGSYVFESPTWDEWIDE